MRVPPRFRHRADVRELRDTVRAQQRDELVEGPRRVADRKDEIADW
jgi:hypothetical protein